MLKNKWFYAGVDRIYQTLKQISTDCRCRCIYQIVTPDRVVEHWQVMTSEGCHEYVGTVVKQGERSSVLVWRLGNLVAGSTISNV